MPTPLARAAAALAACLLAGAAPPTPPTALEKAVRRLEKRISAVRSLPFKRPVDARLVPRPKGTAPGLQGYYSTKEKALYVYDDVKTAYARGVLIHEMVHALQDQHFGLAKLHQGAFGSDAELARAALVEGDATYTMIEVLEKEQPRVAAMLDRPLEKSQNLQNAFLYGQGARYVRALHQRGGWAAVNARYRFPPQNTASILHPGERGSTINLGPGTSRGAFAVVRLLASHPGTAPESVRATSGWRGDRVIEAGAARAWVVAFGQPEQTRRFHKALVRLRAAQKPKWESHATPGGTVWKGAKGEVHAVLTRAGRVHELEAPDEKAYRALQEKVEGPPVLTIYSAREGKTLTFGELTDRLLEADLVCVGEAHDSELHHRVQLQIIKALHARDERLGVGMEMFQRPYQKALDRYLAGATNEQTFLEDAEYQQRWGFDWSLYRPIVEFCRRNGVPLAALNVSRELKDRVSQVGFAKLTAEEKKQIGAVDFHVKEHRAYWYERLAKMHGQTKVPEERKERSYQVMTLWDEYMADSAARFQGERKLRRLVVLAGSGHIERGFGIPQRAAKRTGGKALTVRVELGGSLDKIKADPAADFVVLVK